MTIILLVAVLSGSAAARRPVGNSTASKPSRKSTAIAAAYSIVGTVVPVGAGLLTLSQEDPSARTAIAGIGLLAFGTIAGPSLGHMYAENTGRVRAGILIRTASWGAMGLMLASAANQDGWDGIGMAVTAVTIGGAAISLSTIIDWATVGRSTASYNRKHGFTSMSITPNYDLADNTTGLQLSLRF